MPPFKSLHLQYPSPSFHRILDDPLCSVFLMFHVRIRRNWANFVQPRRFIALAVNYHRFMGTSYPHLIGIKTLTHLVRLRPFLPHSSIKPASEGIAPGVQQFLCKLVIVWILHPTLKALPDVVNLKLLRHLGGQLSDFVFSLSCLHCSGTHPDAATYVKNSYRVVTKTHRPETSEVPITCKSIHLQNFLFFLLAKPVYLQCNTALNVFVPCYAS
jgi:hypothetical protein